MRHRSAHSRPGRRAIDSVIVGTAAVAGFALFMALPSVATPAAPAVPTITVAPAGNASGAAPSSGAPQLGGLDVPAEPDGCPSALSRERGRQLELLAAERAAEVRVIETVTDGSAPAKLDAIRGRATTILGRIADLDTRCVDEPTADEPRPPASDEDSSVERGNAAPSSAPEEPPSVASVARDLAPLAIGCAEVDFDGAAGAAVERAAEELARNEDQVNKRLATEFPRFSRRVAREADPQAARAEFGRLADDLAGTLEDRRRAILDRADDGLADRFADTCQVVDAG